MSDPSFLPPYARASRGAEAAMKSASVRRDDDLDDETDVDDLDRDEDERAIGERPRPAVREGLPPTYRMRHEPHYVEALVAPVPPAPPAPPAVTTPPPGLVSPAAATTPQPTAASREVQTIEATSAAIAAMAASLDAISASLRDLPLRGRPLRDRVAIDLARAEAARARWIADAAAVLQTEPLPALDEVDLVTVCRSVAEAFAPEYRLAGGVPSVSLPAAAPVFGDERLLTTAVGGLLSAMRALVEDRADGQRVAVLVDAQAEASVRSLTITQSAVRLPLSAHARFFDPAWDEHPAGATAALLLAAARRIAEAHGGRLDLQAVDDGGCRLVLGLPAAG